MTDKKKLFIICVTSIIVNGCVLPGRSVHLRYVEPNETEYNGWKIGLTCIEKKRNYFNCFLSIEIPGRRNDSSIKSAYEARIDSFEVISGDTKYSSVNPYSNFITDTTLIPGNYSQSFDFLDLTSDPPRGKTQTLLYIGSDIKYIYLSASISFKSKETGEIKQKVFNIKLKKEIKKWGFIFPMT